MSSLPRPLPALGHTALLCVPPADASVSLFSQSQAQNELPHHWQQLIPPPLMGYAAFFFLFFIIALFSSCSSHTGCKRYRCTRNEIVAEVVIVNATKEECL